MNQSPDHSTQVNGTGKEQGMKHPADEEQAETLHELAREYFGQDFPNPGQIGCPDHASLQAAAQTGRLPADALRAHLFGCSSCFTEYRAALAAGHASVPAIVGQVKSNFWSAWPAKLRLFWSHPTGLAWGVTLLLAALGWFGWTRWQTSNLAATSYVSQTPLPGHTERPAQPAPTSQELRAATSIPSPSVAVPPISPEVSVTIDLSDFVALRDASLPNERSNQTIVLPARRTQLKLRLPEGSLAGSYTVRLVDQREHSIFSTTQVSRDGQQLTVTFDLHGLTEPSYQLELQHPDEPVLLYPVRLAGQRRTPATKPLRSN